MKIWSGYGSEHSMNLVIVGQFKNAANAKDAKELIDDLTKRLAGKIDIDRNLTRYSDDVMAVLRDLKFYNASPTELEQLSYDYSLDLEGDKLVLKTEESDYSLFLKAMVENGAKVEVYSAHHYPDEKYGRGK